jgi:hypothetical protein
MLTDTEWQVAPVDRTPLGQLVSRLGAKTQPVRPPKGGLLPAFLRLADESDDAIAAFATKYGLLLLCPTHGLPRGHVAECPEPRTVNTPTMGYADLIADWRMWASRFRGTVGLAQSVLRNEQVSSRDVDEALGGLPDWSNVAASLRPPLHDHERFQMQERSGSGEWQPYRPPPWTKPTRLEQAFQVQRWMNYLLAAARVGRRIARDPKTHRFSLVDGINPACPLFSVLTMELAGACTGLTSQARCANCSAVFRPRTSAERYCPRCRKDGARLKLAQQKLRAARRAKGLTARGTKPVRSDR